MPQARQLQGQVRRHGHWVPPRTSRTATAVATIGSTSASAIRMRAPEKAAGEILKPRWGETIASHAHSALKYVSAATGATPSQPTADRGRHPGEVMAERSPVRTRVSTYRLSICISSLPSNDKSAASLTPFRVLGKQSIHYGGRR